ncbi:hypothetical protein FOA43_001637 [Brettanomyces nanus]|uniref:DUF788 domain-containing protein n=1 Tax=Eeniella nana TaxID=13502 RepID=A0A875RNY8_EENNA|nr:uncharacterized protein FOA43_001637 [Brettanomyces nanus]QPG74310.1 hypothetical protein FOA43_001637 [Brettanomyces nanus]
MAGQAEKKQAQNNLLVLKEIHIISLIVNLVSLLCLIIFRRPGNYKPYLLLSIPGWLCEYILERIGRPKYETDSVSGYPVLVRAGEDLRQVGLTEYMFDVFYLTQGSDILMCLFGSNKVWWLLALVPVYAAYKIFGLWLRFRGSKQSATKAQADGARGQPEKSKRQLKKEARASKPHYARH